MTRQQSKFVDLIKTVSDNYTTNLGKRNASYMSENLNALHGVIDKRQKVTT